MRRARQSGFNVANAIMASATTLAAALALAGCASRGERGLGHTSSAANVKSTSELASLPTFRGDGTPATFDEVVARAIDAEVVLIGENHGHPVGLPWAAMLFDRVLEGAPAAGLSLEFFERDDQSRVDDYLRGLSDEPTFRKRTERTEKSYPDGHRRMVEAAKAKGRPVIASNAPWQMTRYLRGKDYDALRALTPEQQRLFRIPDELPTGKYRDDFNAIMRSSVENEAVHRQAAGSAAGSGGSSASGSSGSAEANSKQPIAEEQVQAMLAARFRTQSLWDWTMGESVVRAVGEGARPVVQVIGRFHSDFAGGTAQAIQKMRPGTRVLIISVVDEASPTFREDDRGRGDVVVYVGASPENAR